MNSKLRSIICGAILAAGLAAPVLAQTPKPPDNLGGYGTALPANAPVTKTVVVEPGTRSVNVDYQDSVRFVLKEQGKEQSFAWRFDGLTRQVNLGDIYPKAAMKGVPIYINHENNPLRQRGG